MKRAVRTYRSFYISSSGDAGNTGDFPDSAITLAKLLTITLQDGDTIYFNKGETFEIGTWDITAHRISIKSYGTGVKPILTGSEDVGALTWTDEGSGIYSATLGETPKWVYISQAAATQGQSVFIEMTANSSGAVVTASAATLDALNATQSLAGAKLRFKQFDFRVQMEYTIVSYAVGTGQITLNTSVTAFDNYPLWIYGQQQFLTSNGRWFFDSGTSKLYVKAASSPAGTDIRIGTHEYGISCTNYKNLLIDGVELRHYQDKAIKLRNANDSEVTNTTISNCRGAGMGLYGRVAYDINNNTLNDLGLTAIYTGALNGSYFGYNTIYNIGTQTNLPWPTDPDEITTGSAFTYCVDDYTERNVPENCVYEYNTIYNMGYMGVMLFGRYHTVRKNIIHDFCTKLNDGSGIYTIYRSSLLAETRYCTIEDNIVYNGIGNTDGIGGGVVIAAIGIYVDNGASDITVDGNTVYNMPHSGILCNWDTRRSIVTNNNVMGCTTGVRFREDGLVSRSPIHLINRPNTLTGNIIAVKTATSRCIDAYADNGITDYNPWDFGGVTDTNHYVNPYNVNVAKYSPAGSDYTLSGWQTRYSQDAASTERTNYITYTNPTNADIEVKIEVNATDASVNFNVPAGYSDYSGAAFSNPVSIPAWSSLVYLKDTAA